MPKLTQTWKQTKNIRSIKPINSCRNEIKKNVSPVSGFENGLMNDDDEALYNAVDNLEKANKIKQVAVEGISVKKHAVSQCRRKSARLAERISPQNPVTTLLLDTQPILPENYFVDKDGCSEKSVKRDIYNELEKAEDGNVDHSGPSAKIGAENLSLSYWGIPNAVLQQYEAAGVTSMFEWQAECLGLKKVLEGGNLVYSAPTSAGKTLVAELLMLKCVLERKKKAIMILPFVSVTHEKMNSLRKLLKPADVKVDGYMGNYCPLGGFSSVDIAVCTIEKANSLVNRLIEENELNSLGIVVVDEFHMVGDSSRGYLLELLITKLRYIQSRSLEDATFKPTISEPIQIIGMSATLPNLNLLADWIDGELFCTEFRPVPLNECIKVGPTIHSVTNSMQILRKLDMTSGIKDDPDHIIQMCLETVTDGHAVLIFCPTKGWCENLAQSIAREVWNLGKDFAEPATDGFFGLRNKLRAVLNTEKLKEVLQLLKRSPAGLDKFLEKTLFFGVAFHHAGLTFDEREIIENAFRRGIIKVLTATSTLSSGVNLPARRVLIRTPMFHGSLLNVLTYKQMIGRAGRKGFDESGESILVCKECEKQKASTLVTSCLPPVNSCLLLNGCRTPSSCLKRAILEIIVSGIADSPRDVERYVSCTLLATSAGLGKSVMPQNFRKETPSVLDIQQCIQFLVENELIRLQLINDDNSKPIDAQVQRPDDNRYVATPLGKAVLASCLSPDEGLIIFQELERARRCFVLENDLHIVYQVTPIYLNDQWSGLDWQLYWKIWEKLQPAMKRVGECVGVEERFLMRASQGIGIVRSNPRQARLMTIHMRFYTALVLHDLIHEMPLPLVANKYGCNRGLLQSLQQSSSTFAGMVTVFCHHLGWTNLELLLAHFQSRLHFGIQQELCDLVRISCLNGQLARILYADGYKTVASVANASMINVGNTLKNCGPFKSGKWCEDDIVGAPVQQEKNLIWIPGLKDQVHVVIAARCIISEAQKILQSDLGVDKIEWKNSKQPILVAQKCDVKIISKDKMTDSDSAGTNCQLDEYLDTAEKQNQGEDKDKIQSFTPDKLNIAGVEKDIVQLAGTAIEHSKIVSANLDKLPNSSDTSVPVKDVDSNATDVPNRTVKSLFENSVLCEELQAKLHTAVGTRNSNLNQEDNSASATCELNLVEKSPFCAAVDTTNVPIESLHEHEAVTNCKQDPADSFPFEESLILTPNIIKILNNNNTPNDVSIKDNNATTKKLTFDTDEHQTPKVACISMESSLNFSSSSDSVTSKQELASDSDRTPSLIFTDEDSSPIIFEKNVSRETADGTSTLIFANQSTKTDSPSGAKPVYCTDDCVSNRPVINEVTCEFVDDSVFDMIATDGPGLYHLTAGTTKSIVANQKECENPNNASYSEELFQTWEPSDLDPLACKNETNLLRSPPKKLKFSDDCIPPGPTVVEEDDFIPPTPVDSICSKISHSSLKTSLLNAQCSSDCITQLHEGSNLRCLRSYKRLEKRTDPSARNDGDNADNRNYVKQLFDVDTIENSNNKSCVLKNVSCGAIKIINLDVRNGKSDFENFAQEWRRKSKFSVAFACINAPPKIPTGGIGHNVLKAKVQNCAPERPFNTPIRLYDEDKTVVGLAVCWDVSTAYYLNLSSFNSERRARELITLIQNLFKGAPFLSAEDAQPVFIAFDLKEQYRAFYHIFGYLPQSVRAQDPRLASWLLDPECGKLSFCKLVEKFLPHQLHLLCEFSTKKHLCSIGITAGIDSSQSRLYSTTEAVLSLMMMDHLSDQLHSSGLLSTFAEIEMPCVLPLTKMELNGFGFVDDEFQQMALLLKQKLMEIENRAFSLVGRKFSLASVKDVSKVLFSELKLSNTDCDTSPKSPWQTSRPFRGEASDMVKKFKGYGQKIQSTNKEVLHKLSSSHDLPKLVLEWRQIHSALNKIVVPTLKAKVHHPGLKMNRVYSSCSMHTATGRVTLSEPNIQMVPRDFEVDFIPNDQEVEIVESSPPMNLRYKPHKVEMASPKCDNQTTSRVETRRPKTVVSLRGAFIAFHGGTLVAADYSQLELRILAHLSQDTALIHALKNGADVFKSIAAQWKGSEIEAVTDNERQQAKQICYGMIYGIGTKSLGSNLEIDENEAQVFMDSFKSKYPGVKQYIQETVDKCRNLGYVETLMGRRRYLPAISSKSLLMQRHAERQAINTTVQGSAADIVKKAMVEIDRWLADEFPQTKQPLRKMCMQEGKSSDDREPLLGGYLVLQLHDELIYEVAKEDSVQVAQIVKITMEKAVQLSVPLPVKIKIGFSWGSLKEVDI